MFIYFSRLDAKTGESKLPRAMLQESQPKTLALDNQTISFVKLQILLDYRNGTNPCQSIKHIKVSSRKSLSFKHTPVNVMFWLKNNFRIADSLN